MFMGASPGSSAFVGDALARQPPSVPVPNERQRELTQRDGRRIRRAAGRVPRRDVDIGPKEGDEGFEEAVASDVMTQLIRGVAKGTLAEVAGPGEPEAPGPPPDFDGGVPGSIPPPPPPMDSLIRGWRFGRRCSEWTWRPEMS